MNDRRDLSRVDLNLFRVLYEVAQAESITRAARVLHLTQPAVSNALSRLRSHLGDPLFVRDGRRMVATPYARSILPRVEGALLAFDQALSGTGPAFSPAESERHFTFGMRELVELSFVPELGRFMAEHAPGCSFSSVRFERRKLPSMLLSGALDFAIDVRAPWPQDVRSAPLFREPLCFVARRGHPIARRPPDASALSRLRHVAVSGRRTGPMLGDASTERFPVRDIAVRCQSYYAACVLVSQTDLVLALPRRYAEHFRALLDLWVFDAPVPLPELEICLYWHRHAEKDPSSCWARDQLLARRKRLTANVRLGC